MISRNIQEAASAEHDLIVVGGGIYGACMLLEASRRGLECVLVERDDFGGATTWNSLRIIHGGLRYLQTLNLRRCWQSMREREWFLRTFPDLVRPLPCIMPLYGQGLKRPGVFAAGVLGGELLSLIMRRGRRNRTALPAGRVLSVLETVSLFPNVPLRDLRGSGLWYDGAMLSSQRVLMEILRWACSLGGQALNYTEAKGLHVRDGRVRGVVVEDRMTGSEALLRANRVVNCCGPWCGDVAARFDHEQPALFRPSLAFNLLLDREPLCQAAVAVSSRVPGSRVYFMYPFRGRVLAGTAHAPWHGLCHQPRPTREQVQRMLDELSVAVPGLALSHDDVLRVFCGVLPTPYAGSDVLSTREVIHDHARYGGPAGLVSVSGVKFTTARDVAAKTLRCMFPRKRRAVSDHGRPYRRSPINLHESDDLLEANPGMVAGALKKLIDEEAVMSVDDLLLRRTDWLVDPRQSRRVRERLDQVIDVTSHIGEKKLKHTQHEGSGTEKAGMMKGEMRWLRC